MNSKLEDPEINSITEFVKQQFLLRNRIIAAVSNSNLGNEKSLALIEFLLLVDKAEALADYLNGALLNGKSTSIEFIRNPIKYFLEEIDAVVNNTGVK